MTPDPGVHPNVPAADYHGWQAMSRSVLEAGRRSMAHLKHRLDSPMEDTDAMRIGRAVHAAVLEPQDFAAKYTSIDVDRRTKAGKEAWAEAVANFGAGYVLKPHDFDLCCRMRDAVWAKASARGLLGTEGDAELSVVWDDPETNLRCKARYDRASWKIAGGTIVDLKTTTDASLFQFERTIFNMGYHRQAGMYLQGAKRAGISIVNFAVIAVEKEPPYEIAIYRLCDAAVEAGWEQVRQLLQAVKVCQENDSWPGYPDQVNEITLPSWAWDVLDREKETIN